MRFVRVVALAACLAAFACSEDPGSIGEHTVQEFPEHGANEHVDGDVDYEQSPPVAGPHSPRALTCDAFTGIVPEEVMVHTLEHGAVGILFGPEIEQEEQTAIARYVEGSDRKVFSAPFPGVRNPVTIVSWGRMMRLDAFDEGAVDEYVDRYENDAPEPEVECG